jgi:polysaccharide export outer membrane protein
MRIVRSLIVLLAAAMAAAGCTRQSPVPVAVAAAPPPALAPAPGIDNVIYGPVGPRPVPVADAPPPGAVPVAGPPVVAAPPPGIVPFAPPMAFAPFGNEGPYTLDSGDRLRIVVFGQEGLTNSYAVDASGHIAMPLIGSVLARGATTDELSRRIADRLRQGFLREPHVAVEIEAYRPFFILGEVTQPGQYPYVANMTVETAVAIAGGFAPRAFRQTVIVTRFVNGQQLRLTVPVNCPVRPGDTVNVQERWF